eukprot:Colp12_sorted_trinity150504_noHs@35256
MTIKCILFCEFHHIAGPRIWHQTPEGYVSREFFDSIHEYLITKPQLSGHLLTLMAFGHKVVGYPVIIENKKYQRNALMFNVAFVFDPSTSTEKYEPVIRKIARYFTCLEVESEYISREETKANIPVIIQRILNDLNSSGKSTIVANDANTMYLQIFPVLPDPPAVYDHKVPIFITEVSSMCIRAWDLTMQQVWPYINGIDHVKRIAKKADVEIALVRKCMQHLLYYNIITLVDVFQYSNIYMVTSSINRLLDDPVVQQECAEYITKSGRPAASPAAIFALYCRLRPDVTLKDFCIESDLPSLNISERRFVQYGVIRGLLRRLHRYPVRLPDSGPCDIPPRVKRLLDGRRNYDEVCCACEVSANELDAAVQADNLTIVLLR